MNHAKPLLTLLLAAALGACAFGYQARGSLSDIAGELRGKAYPANAAGGARFLLEDRAGHLRCEGALAPPDGTTTPGVCDGEFGRGEMRCSDGRRLALRWQAITCRSMQGSGEDESGNRLQFRLERLR